MIDTQFLIAKRTERGLSQRQLAKHVGVSRETIRRLEHGGSAARLPLGVAFRIAEALQAPIADLLQDEPAQPPNDQLTTDSLDPAPLDHNAARLLRRICRGEDVRRKLSHTDRTLVLPNLLRTNLVQAEPDRLAVTPAFKGWLVPNREVTFQTTDALTN